MRAASLVAGIAWLLAAAPAAQSQTNWLEVVTRTPEGGYRQGNPDAPVKLVEYSSRTCPVCGRFAREGVSELRAKYVATGRVSYEFRDFLVHGAPDYAAALLNQCVPVAEFFPMLAAFFANQDAMLDRLTEITPEERARLERLQSLPPFEAAPGFAESLGMIAFAEQQGLNAAKASACLADKDLAENIARVNASAIDLGLPGTPTFLINGKAKPYVSTWRALEPLLVAALR